MNPELRHVADHMHGLGIGALTHSLRLALYSSHDNDHWPQLSVLHAAHSAEILVKARIAQEHPLLIFKDLPRSTQAVGDLLELEDLFRKGRTLDYHELPERLWATTGIALEDPAKFIEFGQLRNSIQHFSAPTVDASQASLEFIFTVVDPFINAQWGLFAIDYNEEMGDHYEHIFDTLVTRNVRPLISPDAAKTWNSLAYKPGPHAPPGYRAWFEEAISAALGTV